MLMIINSTIKYFAENKLVTYVHGEFISFN